MIENDWRPLFFAAANPVNEFSFKGWNVDQSELNISGHN